MTTTSLTTLDVTIEIANAPAYMLTIYSRVLEELPDHEGSRYYDITKSPRGPGLAVDIDGIPYKATGIILPRAVSSSTSDEVMIVIVRTSRLSRSPSHLIFTCYTQYSQWDIKMDVIEINDDDAGTLDEFVKAPIDDKRRLLGLI